MKNIHIPAVEDSSTLTAAEACRKSSMNNETLISLDNANYFFDKEGTTARAITASGDPGIVKHIVFDMEGAQNVTIDGNGAELIFRDRLTPFVLRNCKHITLRNFTIDFPFSRYCQGSVAHSDESGFTLLIDKELFKASVDLEGHIVFHIGTDSFSTSERPVLLANEVFGKSPWDYIFAGDCLMPAEGLAAGFIQTDAQQIDDDNVRFIYRSGSRRLTYPIGETLLFCCEPRENINIFMDQCEDVKLENIRIYRGGGMGIVAHMTRDIEMDGVRIEVRPDRNECRSTTADGMYFVQCSGMVSIHDCAILDTLDDALNIHGIYTRVEAIEAPDTLVAKICFPPHQEISPFLPGGEIALSDGWTLSEHTRVAIKAAEPLDKSRTRLTLMKPVAANVGDYIESTTLAATFLFERNHVARCPHLRISDPGRKIIRNNHFEQINAILVNDLMEFWYESGAVCDMLFEGNQFDDCPRSGEIHPIYIDCTRGNGTNIRHHNICIKDNVFSNTSGHAVHAAYVDGLRISGNTFSAPEKALHIEHCTNITIEQEDKG